MSAYLICDVTVKDRDKLSNYLSLASHTLEPYGGKFLAQAGATTVVEGSWNPNVVIVAEFPTEQSAHDWYNSKEYALALKVKPAAMERNMIITKGLEKK